MNGKFHLSKLALPQIPLYIIEVFNGWIPDCGFYAGNPLASIVAVPAVEDTDLVDWEYHLERVNYGVGSAFEVFFFFGFHKDTH
jgi:hypothetical protein